MPDPPIRTPRSEDFAEADARVIQGDALQVLRTLESDSVHCVVTSVPYWGLRSYGTEPQIWDALPGCEHEWGDGLKRYSDGRRANAADFGKAVHTDKDVSNKAGQFCLHCNAWRGELGLEPSVALYVEHIVQIFREVRRVLRGDGVMFLNIGDSYVAGPTGHQDISNANGKAADMFAKGGRYRVDNLRKDAARAREWGGLKPKDKCMIPARVAIALQDDGWYLRQEIVWCKKAPMPESTRDRPTTAHEMVYLFSKQPRYYWDQDAVREPSSPTNNRGNRNAFRGLGAYTGGNSFDNSARKANEIPGCDETPAGRNMWSYWLLSPEPYPEAHFATFPTEIPRRAILAGTSAYGCCAECGAPWARVVERTPMVIARSDRREQMGEYGRTQASGTMVEPARAETLGWRPTCTHHSAPVQPCTVLDPFSGAGTTGVVAVGLGRAYVGIELSAEYVRMSERRIAQTQPALPGLAV